MRSPTRYYTWTIIFLVITTIAWVTYLGVSWRDCSDDGGTYVRGLFKMECVNKDR